MRLLMLLVFFVLSCHKENNSEQSQLQQIFTDSTRRDPTDLEKQFIVRTEIGCAGFWVSNNLDRDLIITARHCYGYKITEACNDHTKFYSANREPIAECYRVVAAKNDKDIVMLEVRMLNKILPRRYLKLLKTMPAKNARLQMIGFPADSARYGRPTVSENCHMRGSTAFVIAPGRPQTQDRGTYHDCSVYGGNSGGPMILENSDLAVGLPASYKPLRDESNPIPTSTVDPDLMAKMDLLSDFIEDHEPILRGYKVNIRSVE